MNVSLEHDNRRHIQHMKIKVLGSSAGGGFPQWNCNCRNCDGVRRGTLKRDAAHAIVDRGQRERRRTGCW